MAARVVADRNRRPDPRDLEASASPRRTLGMAAGAVLVLGTVVAGAFGFGQSPDTTPTAAGEPVGALPGRGAPPAHPAEAAPAPEERFVNTAASQSAPQASAGPSGQIGTPASVRPPLATPKAPRSNPPVQQPAQPPANPAPQAPAPGPVQSLSEPVTQTVGGSTLTGVVAPVTSTLDNTLQPALSLIGGLLGR